MTKVVAGAGANFGTVLQGATPPRAPQRAQTVKQAPILLLGLMHAVTVLLAPLAI